MVQRGLILKGRVGEQNGNTLTRVSVFNGSGISGLAARTVEQLTAKGVPAANMGNTAAGNYLYNLPYPVR
ncbi:LytR C-terminal domain-containing protein [Parafrankia sp. Ea1.12]|uniref:LytR C-terminal domain-containing protein n=1 Tax=unclassified Parafrankia TaxID=2994368 RepID=UPI000DA522BC|nr:LytR family transcriptional regulator [Parafrankia sp. BMG5.11]SQD97952.1 hypothetical protein FMEAI12_4410011 [Parafrankia sp. Ea1.12]